MFRTPQLLKRSDDIRIECEKKLIDPGNGHTQEKIGYKFVMEDRNHFYDWYKAYFLVHFKFEANVNGGNIVADTESAPINGSFSLIKNMRVSESNNIHKGIFIKNLLDYSNDYSGTVAKDQFWYLDVDETTVTDANATNLGMRARALLSNGGKIVETKIPLNRYSFFENFFETLLPTMKIEFEITLQDDKELIYQNDGTARRIVVKKFELWVPQLSFHGEGQKFVNETFLKTKKIKFLKERIMESSPRTDTGGTCSFTSAIKNVKHVIFLQQYRKKNSYTQNPYLFDTFNIDGDNSAKLTRCRLNYGENFYPVVYFSDKNKLRIYEHLINYSFRNYDYNSGVQLQIENFESLYPIIHFDLRNNEKFMTNDPLNLTLEYELNETANLQYIIYAYVINEEEFVLETLGNELVVV